MQRWIVVWAGWLMVLVLAACALPPATPAATATVDPVEQGRVLFRDKGCVNCHRNDRVGGETGLMAMGPDLTDYSNSDIDFLRRWLADPAGVRPGTEMIDLGLSEGEIENLIAFLNGGR